MKISTAQLILLTFAYTMMFNLSSMQPESYSDMNDFAIGRFMTQQDRDSNIVQQLKQDADTNALENPTIWDLAQKGWADTLAVGRIMGATISILFAGIIQPFHIAQNATNPITQLGGYILLIIGTTLNLVMSIRIISVLRGIIGD